MLHIGRTPTPNPKHYSQPPIGAGVQITLCVLWGARFREVRETISKRRTPTQVVWTNSDPDAETAYNQLTKNARVSNPSPKTLRPKP